MNQRQLGKSKGTCLCAERIAANDAFLHFSIISNGNIKADFSRIAGKKLRWRALEQQRNGLTAFDDEQAKTHSVRRVRLRENLQGEHVVRGPDCVHPRRCGKSLPDTTLEAYYDINCVDRFKVLF